MAWHLHTVKHRLVLASLIRRNIYASASVCCFLRSGCVSVYHCCLHQHNNFFKPPCHQQQSAYKHTHPQEVYANRLSSTLWPWDSHHASSIRNVKGQADTQDGKESSGEISTDGSSSDSSMHEYHPSLSSCHHHHTPRSQSLHWDRRETNLMCINHKCGYYVHHASVKHDLPTRDTGNTTVKTENEGVEIDKEEANVPLVFKVDSQGRQDILDLLGVEKKSRDNKTIDALNQIVDIIIQTENKNKVLADGQDAIKSTSDDTRSSTPWQYHHLKQSSNKPHFEQRANIKPDWPTHRNTIGAYTRHNSVGRDHVALCSGGQDKTPPVEDADTGDKPSKEQLAVMYHRLYEQIPNFYSQSHDYTMYADNLIFDNRILNVKTVGLPAYKATLQSLKYLSTACLWRVNLEVLNLTINTEMNCVQARWRVTGVPLHHLILFPWKKTSKKYFDAFSSFYVGSDGLIHKHTVDRLMPNPGDKVPSLATRIGLALGILRPQAPAPAMQANSNFNITWLRPRWRLKNNGIIP